MNRDETLQTAMDAINGTRAATYGDARTGLTRIAKLWEQVLDTEVDPDQVAICMALVKIARLVESPGHTESWVDVAGYAALGSEIATEDAERTLMNTIPAPKTATDAVSLVLDMPAELGDEDVVDDPIKKVGKK